MGIKLVDLFEEIIGNYKDSIDIYVSLDKTKHAEERRYRHVDFVIDEDDIIKIAKEATDDIANLLMFDKIDIGDYIHIKKGDLNLIGNVKGKKGMLKIVIVTVMKKANFKPKKDTYSIKI